jgi:alpha-L-rhamnosidase
MRSVIAIVSLGAGLLTAAVSHTGAAAPTPPATLRPQALQCEYLTDPLGIDVEKPRLSWTIPLQRRGPRQTAYRILVASSPETLAKDRGDLWDTGRVASEQSTFVEYGGRPLASGERCFWKVRAWNNGGAATGWSAPALWTMGLLHESDWSARYVGLPRPAGVREGAPLPFPWLRKTVTLSARPRRAVAYVNPLGYYELYINGRKVDDHVLSPVPSDFSRRNIYVTHDVTRYLAPGKNTVALWLGRGWYVRGHAGVIHDGPLVRAQLDVDVPGETHLRVITDDTWKVHESPITPLGRGTAFGDYGGERYDARLEVPDWNATGFDDSGWQNAAAFDPPKVVTAAQNVEPNRIIETVKPESVVEMGAGVHMFKLPRNLTGWFELRLPRGLAAGTTIKLEYSDFPPPTGGGRWQIHNQRDECIVRGAGDEVFRSRFNYHGFGWVRVSGLPVAPSVDDAKAYLIHTAYEPAGEFACSNELLNRIYRMTTYTYRCLTLGGYVVDCPTRERLGYGGDAGTSLETGMFNFTAGGLYNRWLADWRAAQDPNTGDLPFTAPHYQNQGGGGPMWSGFVVTLPWQMYLHYGDRRILETNYPLIRKWLGYLESETKDHVLESHSSYAMRLPQWVFLGDWVPPRPPGAGRAPFGDPVDVKFINTCHYLYQLRLAEKMARLLGKQADVEKYSMVGNHVAAAINRRFLDREKYKFATGEQPYLAFPLLLDIVPPDLREPVARNLEETIRVTDAGHINAGMHGTYFLLKHLMEQDRNDLIYEMVTKRDYPGWGYMLGQGATTAWEDWQGNGSRIHDTLISIGSWFIQGLGGIRLDEKAPGFRHFLVKPAPVGDLTFARARYRSPYGPIASDWRIDNGTFRLDVTVPAGTTATVYLPTSARGSVTEGGRLAARAMGVRPAGTENGRAVYHLAAGKYAFAAQR